MLCRIIFSLGLCALLLTIASCDALEGVTSEVQVQPATDVPVTEGSQVLVSLGEKKLTTERMDWIQPGADSQKIASIAKWWLENELLYEEAERRGITSEPKARFVAELGMKKALSRELVSRVRDSVEISDEQISIYYQENKDTDPSLKQPGYLSFSHIRTKTLVDANSVLERIKAGEDIAALAKELSISGSAQKGGVAKRYMYRTVKKSFSKKFFEAISTAQAGQLVGPLKIRGNTYAVARLEEKTEPQAFAFEKVKDRIKSNLLRKARAKAFSSLMESLKQQAADRIVKSQRVIEAEKTVAKKPTRGNVRIKAPGIRSVKPAQK